jgi:hypothetical protein
MGEIMLNTKLTAALAILGVSLISLTAQADQSMNSTQMQQESTYAPGDPIKKGQLPDGYNASAAYRSSGWDVFITADYLLWRWSQTLASVELIDSSDSFTGELVLTKTVETEALNPAYKSGFQVGLGFNMPNMDDWSVYTEYTWYKNHQSSSLNTGTDQAFERSFGSPYAAFYQIGSFEAEAKLLFNSVAAVLQRTFYVGKSFLLSVGSGLRSDWITQKLACNFDVDLEGYNLPVASVIATGKKQTSTWGIGPKFEIGSSFLLGYGLKFLSDLSASFLYTQYTLSGSTVGTGTVASVTRPLNSAYLGMHPSHVFVPITEASLGLGWGTYLCNNAYHIDLSAAYDINIFWNYAILGTQPEYQNMTLHGLNLQARFDF